MPIQQLNHATFDEAINGNLPVLVDFYADWCGPCRVLAPHVERLAAKYDGVLRVFKLNIDRDKAIAQRYGVSSIPRLMLFDHGRKAGLLVGAQPVAKIEAFIAERLQIQPAPPQAPTADAQQAANDDARPLGIMHGLIEPSGRR